MANTANDLLKRSGVGATTTATGPAEDLRTRARLERECLMNRFLVSLLAVSAVCVLLSMSAFAADLEIDVKVSPNTIVLASEGTLVTIHTNIALSAVDTGSLTLNGIPVAWTKADAKGNLVAKFNQYEIKAILTPPEATLELLGLKTDGTGFSGSDTVVVK